MTFDYSIHYKRFHEDSELHAIAMSEWLRCYLKEDILPDRTTPVLDFGCGFGFALRALKMEGFSNLEGVEISSDQAEIARRAGFNVTVTTDTNAFLRENRSRFGMILLLDVLEHVPIYAQIELLVALREALKAEGRIIVTVPNANSPLACRWRYIDFTHYCSFTEHSLFFVLKNAGFGVIQMDNSKGIGAFPRRWWQRGQRGALRKWLVRFAWLQVFKAELHPNENLNPVCFELNLKAVAINNVS